MNVLLIIGLCLLVLAGILQLRLRVLAEFDGTAAHVQMGLGPLRYPIYPLPQKTRRKPANKRKKKKKPSKNSSKTAEETVKSGLSLTLFRKLLDLALDVLQGVQKRLRIDELILRLDWGLEDPADAAVSYGYAHAVLAGLLTILEVNFKVKKRHTELFLDYTLDQPKVYARASCSIKMGQALSLGRRLLYRGAKLYFAQRKQKKRAKAAQPRKQESATV